VKHLNVSLGEDFSAIDPWHKRPFKVPPHQSNHNKSIFKVHGTFVRKFFGVGPAFEHKQTPESQVQCPVSGQLASLTGSQAPLLERLGADLAVCAFF